MTRVEQNVLPNGLRTQTVHKDELHTLGQGGAPSLYAIFDPCDSPRTLAKITELRGDAESLYIGLAKTGYAEIAPCLARVNGTLLEWILTEIWDEPWGVLICASCEMETLRRHLRKFLVVLDPEGKQVLFRFYDPRVMSVFLPTCTAEELRTFCGPISSFWAQPEVGTEMRLHSLTDIGVP